MSSFMRCIYSLRFGMLISRMFERKNPHGVMRNRREDGLNINKDHVVASVEQCDSCILNTFSATICYISWGMLKITI